MSENLAFGTLIVVVGTLAAVFMFWWSQRLPGNGERSDKVVFGVFALLFLSFLIGLYAFQEKEWAADLLKVVVGIMAGGSVGAAANSIQQQINGNNNFQAVNAQIDNLKSDLSRFEKAIVNVQAISQSTYEKAASSAETIGRHVSQYGADRYISYGEKTEVLRLFPRDVCENSNEEGVLIGELQDMQSAARISFEGYVEAYNRKPRFHEKVKGFIESMEHDGKHVIRFGLDNTGDYGLAVAVTYERRLDI